MFNTWKNVFSNKDVLNKISFTLLVFVLFRIGTFITVPAVDTKFLSSINQTEALGFLDVFGGGALGNFSIFALGISPYITASIIIQLLQMDIIPVLSEWSKEGEVGRKKTNQVTRYFALILAFVQGIAIATGFDIMYGKLLLTDHSLWIYLYIALVMTGGTAILLWLADQISVKGLGNGTSMIILAGIVSRFPYMFKDLINSFIGNGNTLNDVLSFISVIILLVLIVVGVIYMQEAVRKVPVQYPNRHQGTFFSNRKDTYIPLKLNSAGVIPVIFAASLLSTPLLLVNLIGNERVSEIFNSIFNYQEPVGFVIYVALIVAFSYFYAFIQISPEKVAENLKKQGGYIPGIRPGIDTENYISRLLYRLTFVGSIYLTIIAVLPVITSKLINLPSSFSLGGTSILIVVGVALETTRQLENQSMTKNYKGFISGTKR